MKLEDLMTAMEAELNTKQDFPYFLAVYNNSVGIVFFYAGLN